MMKKVLFLAVCSMLLTGMMASCWGGSPDSAVEELMEYLKNKDYDAVINLTADLPTSKEAKARLTPQEYEQMENRGKRELAKIYDDGIRNYKIVHNETDEVAEVGLYYVEITMDNDKELKQAVGVRKNDGKWIPFLINTNIENITLDDIKKFF